MLNSSTGVINGTPTSATGSPFSFSVTVKDSVGAISQPRSLSITVSLACGSAPSKEYIRLGSRVIAVENTACSP
jgi:hypothetical protein